MNATSKKAGAQAPFTMQRLWRQALWGCIAAAALLLAVLAGLSDIGSQRAKMLFASLNGASSSSPQIAPNFKHPANRYHVRSNSDYVVRQLTQTVRGLVEDRDRMAKRLAALERNLDDMTGSISQQIEAAKAPSAPLRRDILDCHSDDSVGRRARNFGILRVGLGTATARLRRLRPPHYPTLWRRQRMAPMGLKSAAPPLLRRCTHVGPASVPLTCGFWTA